MSVQDLLIVELHNGNFQTCQSDLERNFDGSWE